MTDDNCLISRNLLNIGMKVKVKKFLVLIGQKLMLFQSWYFVIF